ncbi:MAG: ABC transporter permease [Filimonas sp.]|nr:ABC transporter permease [Filimonas sp.]
MLKGLAILWNSFRMALQELKVNKLRTFLSLFGITIGIFCIIGVLATIGGLQNKIQTDISTLGSNTIYIDKWDYSGGGPDYPWWKYVNRPVPKYDEVKMIKEKSSLAEYVCYFNSSTATMQYEDNQLQNASIYGVTEDFNKIQTVDIAYGRYLNDFEFQRGNAVGVLGYENAEQLFGNASKAVGQTMSFNKHTVTIIGVTAKQGQSMIGNAYDYDHALLVSYRFYASIYNAQNGDPFIMVKAADQVPSGALVDELRGAMRQVRKLSPKTEDNFALNDVNMFSEQVSGFFGSVNIGGWVIAALSLVVGLFGVANIMFVTVRERTSQIGLKKAIGAKRASILFEFLLESAFLCIIGGLFGLAMVWLLTLVLNGVLPFTIVIAPYIIVLALSLCIGLGMLAGIIPAFMAAKMNPVEAIRSK